VRKAKRAVLQVAERHDVLSASKNLKLLLQFYHELPVRLLQVVAEELLAGVDGLTRDLHDKTAKRKPIENRIY
jgi:hypothetical protein